MIPPSTQAANLKPISFALFDAGELIELQNLIIRPEELTRQEPSRITVLQTLGGAFVDDFGPGIAQITITGTTGWRGGFDEDGLGLFLRLRRQVFETWHARRKAARDAGRDPDTVELIFTDELHGYSVVVVPMQFQLRRSKSRPLLAYYNIPMQVVRPSDTPISALTDSRLLQVDDAVDPDSSIEAVRASLRDAANRQDALSQRISALAGADARDLSDLARGSAQLLDKVLTATDGALTLIDSVTAPLIALAVETQQAARNIGLALAAPLAISQAVSLALNELTGALLDGYCTLVNHARDVRYYFDFSDFYGASSCSSTTGGRPISPIREVNGFSLVYDGNAPEVTISPEAATALRAAASADPLDLALYRPEDLRGLAATISQGLPA